MEKKQNKNTQFDRFPRQKYHKIIERFGLEGTFNHLVQPQKYIYEMRLSKTRSNIKAEYHHLIFSFIL